MGATVRLTLRVRPNWVQVRSIENIDSSECMVCYIQHTVLTSQLCSDCVNAGTDEKQPERINVECKVLKCSNKQYKYNRGCTITTKTLTERVLVGTVFSNRTELYDKLNNLNKGNSVTLIGWFASIFPEDVEDGSYNPDSPDGFVNIEDAL